MTIKTTLKGGSYPEEITYPCLRQGILSGNIYLFRSRAIVMGANLSTPDGHGANINSTKPFVGSITLEST